MIYWIFGCHVMITSVLKVLWHNRDWTFRTMDSCPRKNYLGRRLMVVQNTSSDCCIWHWGGMFIHAAMALEILLLTLKLGTNCAKGIQKLLLNCNYWWRRTCTRGETNVVDVLVFCFIFLSQHFYLLCVLCTQTDRTDRAILHIKEK